METRVPGRVFVSSTCHDLIDLRALLDQRLRDSGLTPIMSDRPASEFKAPGDMNTIETCLVNLRSCEACIVVLSQRYGSLVPDGPYKGKSVTHAEYLEAVKCGIPILFYVRDRLLADWHQSQRMAGYIPVWADLKGWHELRTLIQHRMDGVGGGPDWITSFADALVLIQRVTADLGQTSSEAGLRMLLRQGKIPMITVEEAGREEGRCRLFVWNRGSGPALRLQVLDTRGGICLAPRDLRDSEHAEALCSFDAAWLSYQANHAPAIQVLYEVPSGHVIRELFAILPGEHDYRVVPAGRELVGEAPRASRVAACAVGGHTLVDISMLRRWPDAPSPVSAY